jgi:MFS family permease
VRPPVESRSDVSAFGDSRRCRATRRTPCRASLHPKAGSPSEPVHCQNSRIVDITGRIAFAWFVRDRRAAATFVGLAVIASLLPDIDLWLTELFPAEFHHHGVTHTVVFAVLASVVGGALVAWLLAGPIDDWTDSERFDWRSLFVLSTGAFLAGNRSHIVADVLSAPDTSTPIEPFWPFFDEPGRPT